MCVYVGTRYERCLVRLVWFWVSGFGVRYVCFFVCFQYVCQCVSVEISKLEIHYIDYLVFIDIYILSGRICALCRVVLWFVCRSDCTKLRLSKSYITILFSVYLRPTSSVTYCSLVESKCVCFVFPRFVLCVVRLCYSCGWHHGYTKSTPSH